MALNGVSSERYKMILIDRFFKAALYLLLCILTISGGLKNASAQSKDIKISVSFRPKINKKINIKNFKLRHPIKIAKKEITNHLVSLKYKETSLGNREEHVFFANEISKLAPILLKAFSKVGPEKVIHIEIKNTTGVTKADIFSFKNYISWRFESIHGETFFQKNNARMYKIFAWELVPQKGQLYYKSSENQRLHKNWLVAKLKLPVSKTSHLENKDLPGLSGKDNSDNKLDRELERKLKHLKRLYQQGLIEEEEYKIQQKRLFEKLF